MHSFTAQIKKSGENNGAYVEIPFDVEEAYGAKRVKVKATFDGVPYRGSIVRMGAPCHILGITKAIRSEIGKDFGDEVAITVEKDTEERIVTLSDDLVGAFREAGVLDLWYEQSYSKQKEHNLWIEKAKKAETRQHRISKMIDHLKVS